MYVCSVDVVVTAGANKCSVDVVVAMRIGFAVAVSAAANLAGSRNRSHTSSKKDTCIPPAVRAGPPVVAAQFSNRVSPIEQATVLDGLGEEMRSKAAKMRSASPRTTRGIVSSSSLEGYAGRQSARRQVQCPP
jgi:hypothetical protein